MMYYIILSFDFFLIDIFAHLFVAIQDWTNASTILTSFSVHIEIVWQNNAPLFEFWLWLQAGPPS